MNRATINRLLADKDTKHEFGEQDTDALDAYGLEKMKCPVCGQDSLFGICAKCKAEAEAKAKALSAPPCFRKGDRVMLKRDFGERFKKGMTGRCACVSPINEEDETEGYIYIIDFATDKLDTEHAIRLRAPVPYVALEFLERLSRNYSETRIVKGRVYHVNHDTNTEAEPKPKTATKPQLSLF